MYQMTVIKQHIKFMNKSLMILTVLCLQILFYNNLHNEHKFTNHQMIKSQYNNIESNSILIFSISKDMSKNNKYESYELVKAKCKNKFAHIYNGNRSSKNKNKNMKMVLINKGSSNISTFIELVKHTIKNENPTLCVITEANVKKSDDLETEFPEYHIENKFESYSQNSRVCVLVKKNTIIYTRASNLEEKDLATIWLKIHLSKNSFLYFAGAYRQWKLQNESNILNSNDTNLQIARFNRIINQIKKAKTLSKFVVMGWDSNVDLYDSMNRNDIKQMIEDYRNFMNDDAFQICNKDYTRINQNSSYIDHWLTNASTHCDNINTKPCLLSEHEMVTMLFHTKELVNTPQFRFKIDHSELTRENILWLMNINDKLRSIPYMKNAEDIWETLIN